MHPNFNSYYKYYLYTEYKASETAVPRAGHWKPSPLFNQERQTKSAHSGSGLHYN